MGFYFRLPLFYFQLIHVYPHKVICEKVGQLIIRMKSAFICSQACPINPQPFHRLSEWLSSPEKRIIKAFEGVIHILTPPKTTTSDF